MGIELLEFLLERPISESFESKDRFTLANSSVNKMRESHDNFASIFRFCKKLNIV